MELYNTYCLLMEVKCLLRARRWVVLIDMDVSARMMGLTWSIVANLIIK